MTISTMTILLLLYEYTIFTMNCLWIIEFTMFINSVHPRIMSWMMSCLFLFISLALHLNWYFTKSYFHIAVHTYILHYLFNRHVCWSTTNSFFYVPSVVSCLRPSCLRVCHTMLYLLFLMILHAFLFSYMIYPPNLHRSFVIPFFECFYLIFLFFINSMFHICIKQNL